MRHPSLTIATWAIGLCLSTTWPAHAAADAIAAAAPSASAANPAALTDGEVRKLDKANRTLTLRHGEIKNLDMPGMTMVFQVKDPAWLDRLKTGDRIRFVVERGPTGLLITEIQPAP